MKKQKLKLTVISAMFAAFVCVATIVIKIPTPLNGYINLGDCVILVAAFLLPCGYAALAAGVGSCLADVLLGYMAYAPATFVIKSLMVIVAFVVAKLLKRKKRILVNVLPGVFAELWMVLGYYVFEGFMYGFSASLVNIPMNLIQGVAGLVLAIILIKVLKKQKVLEKLKMGN